MAAIKQEGTNCHYASYKILLYLLLPDIGNKCIKESMNKVLMQ